MKIAIFVMVIAYSLCNNQTVSVNFDFLDALDTLNVLFKAKLQKFWSVAALATFFIAVTKEVVG